MHFLGPIATLDPKSAARMFVVALLDPTRTKAQKNRMVELWNEEHRKGKEK